LKQKHREREEDRKNRERKGVVFVLFGSALVENVRVFAVACLFVGI